MIQFHQYEMINEQNIAALQKFINIVTAEMFFSITRKGYSNLASFTCINIYVHYYGAAIMFPVLI